MLQDINFQGDVMAELSALLGTMSQEDINKLALEAQKANKNDYFIPHPGPQTEAYFSEADILLFGGQPGGGKSGLINGLALNAHYNALIVRRQFTDLSGIVRDCKEFVRTKNSSLKGFTEGNRPRYRKPEGGEVTFEGVEVNGTIDTGKQGNARDFIGVDEGAQLPLDAILMLYGWNRTNREGQRCRMVIASNPPVSSVGDWMAEFFAPWLDPDYINPAMHGELRYFYIDKDGRSIECESKTPFMVGDDMVYPHSRTFIPSSVDDNPCISQDYKSKLHAIPEPARSILLSGNFLALREDPADQLIPTDWVKAAMARRAEYPFPPAGVPMCNMGVDPNGGGKDLMTIAPRYDWWFDDLETFSSDDLFKNEQDRNRYGKVMAGRTLASMRDDTHITIDMGGGYGSGMYEYIVETIDKARIHAYKGSEAAAFRSKSGFYSFVNVRSAALWKFREALDPSQNGGSPICLPDDKTLLSDLTAPTYEITTRGIKAEPKDKVKEKLNRSPDRGDAVIMSWYYGQLGISPQVDWKRPRHGFKRPAVNVGYMNRKRIKR